jgi:hypothetical protein
VPPLAIVAYRLANSRGLTCHTTAASQHAARDTRRSGTGPPGGWRSGKQTTSETGRTGGRAHMRDPGSMYAPSCRRGAGRQHVSGGGPPPHLAHAEGDGQLVRQAALQAQGPAQLHHLQGRAHRSEGHQGPRATRGARGRALRRPLRSSQGQGGTGRSEKRPQRGGRGEKGEAAGGGQGRGPHLVDAHFRTQLHGGHIHRLDQRLLHRDLPASTRQHRLSTGRAEGRGAPRGALAHTPLNSKQREGQDTARAGVVGASNSRTLPRNFRSKFSGVKPPIVYGSSTMGYLALLHSKDEPPSARAAAGRGRAAGLGSKQGQDCPFHTYKCKI